MDTGGGRGGWDALREQRWRVHTVCAEWRVGSCRVTQGAQPGLCDDPEGWDLVG